MVEDISGHHYTDQLLHREHEREEGLGEEGTEYGPVELI